MPSADWETWKIINGCSSTSSCPVPEVGNTKVILHHILNCQTLKDKNIYKSCGAGHFSLSISLSKNIIHLTSLPTVGIAGRTLFRPIWEKCQMKDFHGFRKNKQQALSGMQSAEIKFLFSLIELKKSIQFLHVLPTTLSKCKVYRPCLQRQQLSA